MTRDKKPQPSLVIEYHYDDGDVGAHPAGSFEEKLFEGFSGNPNHKPSHILIRIDSHDGQELSNSLHTAFREHLKEISLRKITHPALTAEGQRFLNVWAAHLGSKKPGRQAAPTWRAFQIAVSGHPEAQAIRAQIEWRVDQILYKKGGK